LIEPGLAKARNLITVHNITNHNLAASLTGAGMLSQQK
jgi:hypothetical protein